MAGFENAVATLRRAEGDLTRQLDSVRAAIAALSGGGAATSGRRRGRPPGTAKKVGRPRRKRTMSAEARKRISDAQKARWAKQKKAAK